MDTFLILVLPLVGALALFWCAARRKKGRKFQMENGMELLGTVTGWEKRPAGRDVFFQIEVEANGTTYQIFTQSVHGAKYKRRKDVRILVNKNEEPDSLQDTLHRLMESTEQIYESFSEEEHSECENQYRQLMQSLDQASHAAEYFDARPKLLPVLWEDRVTVFNIAFPIVFGGALLAVSVIGVIVCITAML